MAILGYLEMREATDDELCQQFPHEHPGSVSKRRNDLVRAGLVVDSGRTRLTRRSREAVIWSATRNAQCPPEANPAGTDKALSYGTDMKTLHDACN